MDVCVEAEFKLHNAGNRKVHDILAFTGAVTSAGDHQGLVLILLWEGTDVRRRKFVAYMRTKLLC